MRAIQVFSYRLRVPVIVAALLACSLGSAQAAVVFTESLADSVINTVLGAEFTTHYFTVSQSGTYRATITDLNSIDPSDPFFDAFTTLDMKITDSAAMALSLTASAPGSFAFVDFTAPAAGTFAALVKAVAGSTGSGYQVAVALIPEPAVWAMLAAGFGLLGFVRIRRAAHNGI